MPPSVSHPEEGIDTALARLLHEQGLVDLSTLQAILTEARERKKQDPSASLAGLLKSRQVVSERDLEHSLGLLGARAEAPTEAPTRIGSYQVVREIARGGMGVVYQVLEPNTGTHYALKTILTHSLPSAFDEERTRFLREAEVLARLRHPHIVQVHAADLEGSTPYLVQDYLPGGTLQERLRKGPLPVDEAIGLIETLADALEHAHRQGVLHRDLKPLNVLFDDRGTPRLVDFGLALRLAEQERLTQTGLALGSPGYLAPEQASGQRDLDARTDVYGLGAMLYALLTGQPPFTGRGLGGLAEVAHDPPPALRQRRPDAPIWLEAVVAKALAKRPADRFGSAAAFAAALRAEAPVAIPRRRSRLLPALLAVLLIAAPLAGLAWKSHSTRSERSPVDLRNTIRKTLRTVASLQELESHLPTWEAQIDRSQLALGPLTVARGLLAVREERVALASELLERAEQLDPASHGISGLRGGVAWLDSSRLAPDETLRHLGRAISEMRAWELVSWRAQARLRAGLTTSADRGALRADLDRLRKLPAARTESHRRLEVELELAERDSDRAAAAVSRLTGTSPILTWRLGLLRAREAIVREGDRGQVLAWLPAQGPAPACPEATTLGSKLDALILERVPPGADQPGAPPASREQCQPLLQLIAIRARLPLVQVAAKTRAALVGLAGNYERTENNLHTVRLAAAVGELFPTDHELQVRLAVVAVRGTALDLLLPATLRALQLTREPTERFRLAVIAAWLRTTKVDDRDLIRRGVVDCRRLRRRLPELALDAKTPFARHLRLVDPVLPRLWASEGEALHHLGDHAGSLRCHETVVAMDRGSEGARSHAAQVREQRELNRLDEAVRCAREFVRRRGLDLDPPTEVVLDQLWHVPTDAARRLLIEGFWSYLPKTDKFRNWWVRLAWLEHEVGDKRKAAQALRKAAAAFRRGQREQPAYTPLAQEAERIAGLLEQGDQPQRAIQRVIRALLGAAFRRP